MGVITLSMSPSRLHFVLLWLTNEANVPHLHVQLLVPRSGLSRGESAISAGLYFKLEPGWHIYWKNAGDSGEPPHVRWSLPEGISAGALQFPAPTRMALGPMMDFGYENEVLLPFKLRVASTTSLGSATLRANVDWLVCREVCLPGRAELEVVREVLDRGVNAAAHEPDSGLYARLSGNLPTPLPAGDRASFQLTPTGFRLSVDTGHSETQATFFPSEQGIIDNPASQKLIVTPKGLILDLKKDANLTANPAELKGVLELRGGRVFELAAEPGRLPAGDATHSAETPVSAPSPSTSSPLAEPAAAIHPTPSTPTDAFPAAPLSWLVLARTAGMAFVGGLILNLMPCVFPVLFLKGLALVQSGNEKLHELRMHGLIYMGGILVSFWVLVALLLGLRLAGEHLGWGFQFQSPVFLALMACLLFFLGLSLAGQFEIGLTLTSAGGSLAARQGYTGSFFTGVLAVVVATPCTAPFMGTAIGYALAQKPAATFAIFTAIALGLATPYVALTLQPSWTRLLPRPGVWMEVLKQAVSVPIFATVIWLAWVLAQAYGANMLAALLTCFLLLAVAGWFLGRWPAKHWATGLVTLLLLAVIGVSVLAPRKLVTAAEIRTPIDPAGQWEPWSPEAVGRYRAQGRPVFVDFSASWCLSCQVNERVALHQTQVEQAFHQANVALLRADWTRHDEAITQALAAMGRSGVPAYALYVPGEKNPQLLPEVLVPSVVMDALGRLPGSATRGTATR
jgi:thiol:disulfide interchange protein DsbD